MSLLPQDPLAHRALEYLLKAETSLRRTLTVDLQREGLSSSGFSMLIVLAIAGGELELRTLRQRFRTSKANATEVISTLQARGLVRRERLRTDRRAVAVILTPAGDALVQRVFPEHTDRVRRAFSVLDESEKRSLMSLCRKLAA